MILTVLTAVAIAAPAAKTVEEEATAKTTEVAAAEAKN